MKLILEIFNIQYVGYIKNFNTKSCPVNAFSSVQHHSCT